MINAHLIAAAPQMLAALEDTTTTLAIMALRLPQLSPLVARNLAAIAAAKGER